MIDTTEEKQFHLKDANTTSGLQSWKNEPSLQVLKNDWEMSKASHDEQVSKINRWNDLMQVKGSSKTKKIKGRSSVQPKLIRRQAEWRYSALSEPFLGSNKIFKISGATFEDSPAAAQNELVLNWQFRTKLNRVKFVDDYVRSAVDDGTCIVRLGWKRVVIQVDQEVPVWSYYPIEDEQSAEMLQQALSLEQEDPRGYEEKMPPEMKAAVDYYKETQQPTTAVEVDISIQKVDKVIENRPTVEIMNPQNVYIDPSCLGDIDKALFIGISFETNESELKKEGKRYHNLDKIDWEGNTPMTDTDHATSTPDTFQFNDRARKKVIAHEYWGFYDINKDGTLVPIVATWIGNVIIRMEESPFPDGKLPFVVVNYLPVKRELYGEPDAELLEDNQNIIGAVTRGMIDLLGRSANSQQGFAKGMLDPLNRRRYDNGEDYEYNPNTNPQVSLIEHKYPEIPQSALLMLNLQNQEAESLTGVKSFNGGISGESYGDVAAGIRGALDAASKREMAILRRLAKGITDIGTKIISMNGEFLSEKEVVRVTNDEYITISREDLKGNFDMEVDISTAEIDDSKSKDLSFMLQTIGPKSDNSIVMMLLSEIAKLKRMPELAHKLISFKPEPDPIQQELAQLEVERAKKEIEKLDSEIQFNMARAGLAGSEKDTKDLGFVEQESGTKHAREMQKQGAQARANQSLEVTKALIKSRKEGESQPDIAGAIGYNAVSEQLANQG